MFSSKTIKCSVCGNKSSHEVWMLINILGRDLDTRPCELNCTMEYWIQECPHCGYVASSLKNKIKCGKEYLDTSDYKNFSPSVPISELAQAYIRKARIATKYGDYVDAFSDYLCAAWASDDAEDDIWQIEARLLALQMMDMFDNDDMNNNHYIIRADLLRKTLQFERLIQEYERIHLNDDSLNKIIQFQIIKARNQDTKTYADEDVIPRNRENMQNIDDYDEIP